MDPPNKKFWSNLFLGYKAKNNNLSGIVLIYVKHIDIDVSNQYNGVQSVRWVITYILLRKIYSQTNINTVNQWCSLEWRHNEPDGVSNHQPRHCLFNRLFRRRSKKTSKPRVTGLCAGNSQGTGEFPAQMASNAENVSIWWRLLVLH